MPLRALAQAIRFLTILPLPARHDVDERIIARSMAAFPLVGALIGALTAAAGWVAASLWGSPTHAIVVVVAGMWVTSGFHLDGVADTCDAAFSWRDRERKLEIMRDSRIGTMGALGLIAVVLLKVGGLLSLGEVWWLGALLAPVWGRWCDIYGIYWFPAAREDGLGQGYRQHVRRLDFAAATALALALGWLVAGVAGMLVLLPLTALVHYLARILTRTFGGLTGDTYGALCEVGEVASLYLLAAWFRHPDAVRAATAWLSRATSG